jgi:hypothetical protein
MFNIKAIAGVLVVTFAILFATSPILEARHCHHHCNQSRVNINFGPIVPAPAYVVSSPAYAPIYVAPQPVYAYPVYQPVYVAPQPRLFTGFSFGWFFH